MGGRSGEEMGKERREEENKREEGEGRRKDNFKNSISLLSQRN